MNKTKENNTAEKTTTEDWVECRLGEIFETVTGNTPPKKDPENYGKDIPFIKPPDITNSIISSSSVCLSEQGKKKGRILPVNSVLVTCIGNLGRIGINKYEIAFNQQINAIKPLNCIVPKFTFYQAQSTTFRNQLEELSTSTTVALVNKTSFNSIRFKIPPLPIQYALVRKIETLFSSLDDGIADLKKAQEQLKTYRQAVLKKVFEGDWETVELEKISTTSGGYAFKSKSFLKETGKYQIIRIGNVRPGLIRFDASPVYLNEIDEKVKEKYLLKKGDVIITLTGTRKKRDYGYTAMVKSDNLLLNQRLAYLRFYDNYLPLFFLYFSWSEQFKEQFFSSETGNVGQGNVGMKSVKKTLVPNIPKNEQQSIVQEIESRLSVCDAVEENIKESLEKAASLRQSILKKAFSGKLLNEKEIEECKNHPDYEPTEKLLEKIRNHD